MLNDIFSQSCAYIQRHLITIHNWTIFMKSISTSTSLFILFTSSLILSLRYQKYELSNPNPPKLIHPQSIKAVKWHKLKWQALGSYHYSTQCTSKHPSQIGWQLRRVTTTSNFSLCHECCQCQLGLNPNMHTFTRLKPSLHSMKTSSSSHQPFHIRSTHDG